MGRGFPARKNRVYSADQIGHLFEQMPAVHFIKQGGKTYTVIFDGYLTSFEYGVNEGDLRVIDGKTYRASEVFPPSALLGPFGRLFPQHISWVEHPAKKK